MAPCDKYAGLVVGPDGQTRSNPYGSLATVGDYEEWRQVADRIIGMAEAEAALSPAPADVQTAAALRAQWEAMGGAIWQSFTNFPELTWGASILAMVELAADAACQLGIIESHVIAGGGESPAKPDAPQPGASKGMAKIGGKGMLVLVGLGLYFFSQRGDP